MDPVLLSQRCQCWCQSRGCDRWPKLPGWSSAELGGITFGQHPASIISSALQALSCPLSHKEVTNRWCFSFVLLCPVGWWCWKLCWRRVRAGIPLGNPPLGCYDSIIPPNCGGLNLHQPRCLGSVKSVSHRNVSLVKPHLFSLPSGLLLNAGAKLCFHCQRSLIFRNECGQCYCFTYSLNGKKIEFPRAGVSDSAGKGCGTRCPCRRAAWWPQGSSRGSPSPWVGFQGRFCWVWTGVKQWGDAPRAGGGHIISSDLCATK